MVEEVEQPAAQAGAGGTGVSRHRWLGAQSPGPVSLAQARAAEGGARWPTGFHELDRVLGGGLVPGSLVLVGGDPGIGKSTLLVQVAAQLAAAGRPLLYVSGEESAGQVALRAQRVAGPGAEDSGLLLLTETDLVRIEEHIMERAVGGLAVIDSIQTLFHPEVSSAPGSVGQVRACAAQLLRLAKTSGTTIVLVGHVTKDGEIAGPRTLEHATDVVLYMEGDPHHPYRIVRSVKNRYGSTRELGIFEMTDGGLAEVPDPSGAFLAGRPQAASGSIVVAGLEGSRPLLVEVQSLVAPSPYPHPRRTAAGLPVSRVDLLLAVLERRAGLNISGHDVFVKVSGGLTLSEPAADLGIALALASAFTQRPAQPQTAVFGEVGLAGEIRAVHRTSDRLREAVRLGFTHCVVPQAPGGQRNYEPVEGLTVTQVASVQSALAAVFS